MSANTNPSIYHHNSPRKRILDNPFTTNVSYNPIFFAEELAAASHCPRKGRFLRYEGNYTQHIPKDTDFYRHTDNTSGVPTPWHNGSIFAHYMGYDYLIKATLNQLQDQNNLLNTPFNAPYWSTFWRDAFQYKFRNRLSNELENDVLTFLARWSGNGRLQTLINQKFGKSFTPL